MRRARINHAPTGRRAAAAMILGIGFDNGLTDKREWNGEKN
jgi:hypothetical protein